MAAPPAVVCGESGHNAAVGPEFAIASAGGRRFTLMTALKDLGVVIEAVRRRPSDDDLTTTVINGQ